MWVRQTPWSRLLGFPREQTDLAGTVTFAHLQYKSQAACAVDLLYLKGRVTAGREIFVFPQLVHFPNSTGPG